MRVRALGRLAMKKLLRGERLATFMRKASARGERVFAKSEAAQGSKRALYERLYRSNSYRYHKAAGNLKHRDYVQRRLQGWARKGAKVGAAGGALYGAYRYGRKRGSKR